VEALWLCCLAVSLPHVFYLWLWRSPARWLARCRHRRLDPSFSMARWALGFKAVQAGAFICWVVTREQTQARMIAELQARVARRDAGLALSIALLSIGQVLNGSCFRALGVEGIYYGIKFGKKIPWCTSWPYGGALSIPHPQYVGCVLTIWAMILALCTPQHYDRGALGLGAFWSILYVFSAIVEQKF